MYELKKLNLKQSEKYMTYKCNEYGKHYKKFSRIIPVVVIITLVAAFLVPSQSKVIYALGVAITAGLFFMVYSYYKQMVSLQYLVNMWLHPSSTMKESSLRQLKGMISYSHL